MERFDVRRFLQINIGVIVMVVGLYFFFIPNHFIVGGISGLSQIIQFFFPRWPISFLMACINIVLLVIAFVFIGKDFGGYTVYASLATSGYLFLLERLLPLSGPLTHNLLLNLFYGCSIAGLGMGLIFNAEASTGGTDIIAKIISMVTHLDIGKSLLIPDFLIVFGSVFVFDLETGLFSLMGIYLQAFFIDYAVAGFRRRVKMEIHSKEVKAINDFIHHTLNRGSTIYEVVGGYTGNRQQMISTVLTKREYLRVKALIEEIDPKAFVTVHYITEAMGEGFTYDGIGQYRLSHKGDEGS